MKAVGKDYFSKSLPAMLRKAMQAGPSSPLSSSQSLPVSPPFILHPLRRPNAARPPDSAYFQKDRDTIEKRSGRWLEELARQSQTTGFDLNAWIPAWEAGDSGRQPRG